MDHTESGVVWEGDITTVDQAAIAQLQRDLAAARADSAKYRAALEAVMEGLESAQRIFLAMAAAGIIEKSDNYGEAGADKALAQARAALDEAQ